MGLLDKAKLDKAKGLLGKNADKVRGGIDKAANVASSKLGDKVGRDKINTAAEKAKSAVDQLADDAAADEADEQSDA